MCSADNYRALFLSTLPQVTLLDGTTHVLRCVHLLHLRILSGSHSSLDHAVSALEKRAAELQPDRKFCSTPPLEPWLAEGSLERSTEGDLAKINAVFEDLQSSIDRAKSCLSEDCSRLLRSAQSALSKSVDAIGES